MRVPMVSRERVGSTVQRVGGARVVVVMGGRVAEGGDRDLPLQGDAGRRKGEFAAAGRPTLTPDGIYART
ncbi:hypothetical protein GCM10009836_13710 [Pseudonocardia ailaonensis]|uniref:Uncharacterized protein n=1 Tax=Pseudonocardia ailaonensis TaxID=367279 RepID=A0ABN2MTG5_9PSEU